MGQQIPGEDRLTWELRMDSTRVAPVIQGDPDEARAELGGRRVGPHVAIAAGLHRAAERARLVGAGAIQVFTDNPTAWSARSDPHAGLDEFRGQLRAWRIELLVHASYLINLATPDQVVRERSVLRMHHELDAARGFGASALNVHIGSHKGSGPEAGIERVGETLARIFDQRPMDDAGPMLVLEDSAGQGGGVGVTIEELGAILDAAERHGADRSRLGVCLDTAHLWGAGYAIDDPLAIDALLESTDRLLGPDGLAMIHLNDSRVRRGSRSDRHEHVGAGAIGGGGLGHLLRHPRLVGIPVILETPGMDTGWDAVNMSRVRTLLAGGTLEPLPPEAFMARGDRS
jgi:deoxyribonuclease-4